MSNNHVEISDSDFLTQFENQLLDPVYFDHLGHIRIAWLYLNAQDLDTAVESVSTGIKSYAESLGAKDKFHSTITYALIRIIDTRIQSMREHSWQRFINENSDLIEDSLSVLFQYFSKDLLLSELAKVSRVNPNLRTY